ncbi:MAG: DUF1573 domain-containing protein [Flavobacteriales bacterium]|nr:DUF1573 domain-containing protein [Flavobacteriales bacterium]
MRISFVLLLPLWLMISGCADVPEQVTPELINFPKTASGESDEDLPVITFEHATLDFGVIAEGEIVRQTYKFTNTGSAALVIAQVVAACGCTTLKDWPKGVINPGESGEITVEFNSENRVGKVDKTIDVQANTVPSTTKLHLTGEVKGPGN